jgi:ParB family chromosome partitioning protein
MTATVHVLHVEHPDARAAFLPVDAIDPNPRQPRTVFDDADLADLVASIRQDGILQPLLVRPAGDRYQLVAGERRLRAAQTAELALVPVTIRDIADSEMLRLAIVENIQRADLNLMEEAAAVAALIDEAGCTQIEVAGLLGISRARVTHLLGLLRLSLPVQRRIAAGVLTLGHARALIGIRDPAVADRLAERIVSEGLTVRNVEELVAMGNLPGTEKARTRRRRPSRSTAEIPQIATGLERWLDTRVKVLAGAGRGRIVVEFADLNDLDRVLKAMRVPLDLFDQQPADGESGSP